MLFLAVHGTGQGEHPQGMMKCACTILTSGFSIGHIFSLYVQNSEGDFNLFQELLIVHPT